MTSSGPEFAERILDKALELGEAESWEAVRLHAVADELAIPLDEVRKSYPQKDDLVEAWFDRADRAVLGERAPDTFLALPARERLVYIIMTWLHALEPHRRLTRQMLAYKFEFGHIHLQALGLMRISRTVQWFREAACREATGLRRIMDESVLTTIYLATFARWLFDDSPDSSNTRRFLDRALRRCEVLEHNVCECLAKAGCCERPAEAKPADTGPIESDAVDNGKRTA